MEGCLNEAMGGLLPRLASTWRPLRYSPQRATPSTSPSVLTPSHPGPTSYPPPPLLPSPPPTSPNCSSLHASITRLSSPKFKPVLLL